MNSWHFGPFSKIVCHLIASFTSVKVETIVLQKPHLKYLVFIEMAWFVYHNCFILSKSRLESPPKHSSIEYF